MNLEKEKGINHGQLEETIKRIIDKWMSDVKNRKYTNVKMHEAQLREAMKLYKDAN